MRLQIEKKSIEKSRHALCFQNHTDTILQIRENRHISLTWIFSSIWEGVQNPFDCAKTLVCTNINISEKVVQTRYT